MAPDKTDHPKLLITMRQDVHRVMDIQFVDELKLKNSDNTLWENADLRHMSELESIFLNGESISFYHQGGYKKGFVRDAVNPGKPCS